jgi:hypothetical protein
MEAQFKLFIDIIWILHHLYIHRRTLLRNSIFVLILPDSAATFSVKTIELDTAKLARTNVSGDNAHKKISYPHKSKSYRIYLIKDCSKMFFIATK